MHFQEFEKTSSLLTCNLEFLFLGNCGQFDDKNFPNNNSNSLSIIFPHIQFFLKFALLVTWKWLKPFWFFFKNTEISLNTQNLLAIMQVYKTWQKFCLKPLSRKWKWTYCGNLIWILILPSGQEDKWETWS